ncbi:MAG: IspD/TarI family cytidylyltransferase [Coraliomargaritaceae bacterium]
MNCAILLAAGSGTRMGDSVEDKILFPIKGEPVICYSIKAFTETKKFDHYIIVYRDEIQKENISNILPADFILEYKPKFIKGGDSRQASVFNALQELDSFEPSIRYVAIHDVARPLIGAELISKLLTTAENYKNAIPATLITDTVKQINEVPENDSSVIKNLDRSKLRSIQTPQIFDFNLIKECYQMVFDADRLITDDSSALTFSDIGIKLLINDQPNPKLTTKNDLDYILYLLNQNPL